MINTLTELQNEVTRAKMAIDAALRVAPNIKLRATIENVSDDVMNQYAATKGLHLFNPCNMSPYLWLIDSANGVTLHGPEKKQKTVWNEATA
jgi:hypothetical protein